MAYCLSLGVRHNAEDINNSQSILSADHHVLVVEQKEVQLTQILALEVIIIQQIAAARPGMLLVVNPPRHCLLLDHRIRRLLLQLPVALDSQQAKTCPIVAHSRE
jgi:hypothetical protein